MILKVTLKHEIEGSIEIPEPDGWKGAQIGVERDPELWTMSPFIKTPFNAMGAFRSWCLLVEKNHGPDAIITAQIRYSPDDRGLSFVELFPNSDIEIAVASFTETVGHEIGHGLEYGFVLRSFYAKFQQRFETPVNVQSEQDLDGNEVDVIEAQEVPLSPQIINARYQSKLNESIVLSGIDWVGTGVVPTRTISTKFNDQWLQFSLDDIINEVEDIFHIPIGFNPELPVFIYSPKYSGQHRVTGRMIAGVLINVGFGIEASGINHFPDRTVLDFFYQINGGTPVQFGTFTPGIPIVGGDTNPGGEVSAWDIDETFDLKVGDELRIFGKFTGEITSASAGTDDGIGFIIFGEDSSQTPVDSMPSTDPGDELDLGVPDTDIPFSYINIDVATVFPETTAQGFLTHDLLHSAIQRICGVPLYSEVLGSPNTVARQYDYVGCAANFMHFKGLQLRQYLLTEKPFFISVKDIWNGINPVHCLAMGMDKVNGVDVVRVWKRSELFDETRVSATFDNVRDISRSYDQEEFFNLVTIGYDKWESGDIGGIDDPQSKRYYATILKKIGKRIEILSSMIGASLAFETTRRFIKLKSADYKLDNETFILAVTLDEYGFKPELSEEFSAVTDLLNEETRYNKGITSARNMLRWLDYLSGCLQAYLSSGFKFTGGEGNYHMQATMAPNDCGDDFGGNPLSEKQDLPVSENYLFWPIAYTINSPISFGKWLQIIGDMNAAIKISQSNTGHMPFFTKSLTVVLSDSKMTLNAWPKRFFPIEVVQNSDTEHENRTGRRFDDTFGPQFN